MKLVVNKEKKMADVIEAMSGAVMLSSGMKSAQSFLKRIGVLKVPYNELVQLMEKEKL